MKDTNADGDELFPAYAGVILDAESQSTGDTPFPRIRRGDP